MYIGLPVNIRYSCQILMKHKFSRQSFEKKLIIKFYINFSIGSWVVLCGRTDRQACRI